MTAPAPQPPRDAHLSTTAKARALAGRVQAFRQQHAVGEAAAFFVAGLLFDIFTLSRIDDLLTLVQQGAYLTVLGGLLVLEQKWADGRGTPPKWMAKAWRFSEDAIHFLFGSLLSSYTLFFFKSASGLTSLTFLAVLFGLLVANELPRFRGLGPVIRAALFSLCVAMYLAYLLPVLVGFLSGWLFLLALVLTGGVVWGVTRLVERATGDRRTARLHIATPGLGAVALLGGLYLLKVIPPVPLAVESIGIYHGVEKDPATGTYVLKHERPTWKLWHRGDQDFRAQPGDTIYVFARVFSPARFRDRIRFRWHYDDPKRGWTDQGSFAMAVTGGRDGGYRAFATKEKYQPGDWRVTVETEDGRTFGRISFTVEDAPAEDGPRIFYADRE